MRLTVAEARSAAIQRERQRAGLTAVGSSSGAPNEIKETRRKQQSESGSLCARRCCSSRCCACQRMQARVRARA